MQKLASPSGNDAARAIGHFVSSISRQARCLRMVEIGDYMLIGKDGTVRPADVFDGHSQLMVYDNMSEDGAEWQCGGC